VVRRDRASQRRRSAQTVRGGKAKPDRGILVIG
jgi:hypothetical protein